MTVWVSLIFGLAVGAFVPGAGGAIIIVGFLVWLMSSPAEPEVTVVVVEKPSEDQETRCSDEALARFAQYKAEWRAERAEHLAETMERAAKLTKFAGEDWYSFEKRRQAVIASAKLEDLTDEAELEN